ncbi:MAG: hypothetical protein HPPSJP_2000 [Candidatus Hepatoplasma scabrum]|nr:MAG: hypothetical protein HPPSJP_2000 [Candidatus Hepatoplasma sp.]
MNKKYSPYLGPLQGTEILKKSPFEVEDDDGKYKIIKCNCGSTEFKKTKNYYGDNELSCEYNIYCIKCNKRIWFRDDDNTIGGKEDHRFFYKETVEYKKV